MAATTGSTGDRLPLTGHARRTVCTSGVATVRVFRLQGLPSVVGCRGWLVSCIQPPPASGLLALGNHALCVIGPRKWRNCSFTTWRPISSCVTFCLRPPCATPLTPDCGPCYVASTLSPGGAARLFSSPERSRCPRLSSPSRHSARYTLPNAVNPAARFASDRHDASHHLSQAVDMLLCGSTNTKR